MVLEIKIFPQAQKEIRWTLVYIEQKFGRLGVTNFEQLLSASFRSLQMQPEAGVPSDKIAGVRKLHIHKRATIYYRYRPRLRRIDVVSFWDTRRNPAKRKY